MEILSESKKILLAKLKFRDTEKYKEKLSLLEISESELKDYIQKEDARRKSIESIKTFAQKDNSLQKYTHRTESSPYRNYQPPTSKAISNRSLGKVIKDRKKAYIMVDGDNHPYEAIVGIENIIGEAIVNIFAADKNLLDKISKSIKEKLGSKSRKQVHTFLVKKGAQAVDNKIYANLEKEAKRHVYSKIVIVSHDQGYIEKIKKCKQKYGWTDNGIILRKCIQNALN